VANKVVIILTVIILTTTAPVVHESSGCLDLLFYC